MVKIRRRHTAATHGGLQVPGCVEVLEGSKTIRQCLHYCTPAEKHFVF